MRKKDFSDLVEFFLKQSDMRPTTLGVLAIKDPKFVIMLRSGRECREKTQEKVVSFMREWAKEHHIGDFMDNYIEGRDA